MGILLLLGAVALVVGVLSHFGLVRGDSILGLPKFISALIIAGIVLGIFVWYATTR